VLSIGVARANEVAGLLTRLVSSHRERKLCFVALVMIVDPRFRLIASTQGR